MEFKELKTERLVLRKLRAEDIPLISKYANDKEMSKNTLTMPYPYTEEDAADYFEKCEENYFNPESKGFIYAIELDGEYIGNMGVHNIVKNHKAEIGYWIGKPFWGKGLMSEALKKISDYLLYDEDFSRIYLMTFDWNKASSRVAEKAGFEYEGTLKNYEKKDGVLIDVLIYAKIIK